jgi:hypothetical protein
MKPPIQLHDGDYFTVSNGDIYRDVCCQCSMAHLVQLSIMSPDRIKVTTWVDPKKPKAKGKRGNDEKQHRG